jgi:hypothetical protein
MSESEWFIISDLSDFTDKARAIVYNNFGSWQDMSELGILMDDIKDEEQEEFENTLSHRESLVIVKENIKKQKNKRTQKVRYILNDTIFADIVHKLHDRIVSNIIRNLVQKGLVETAFDDEANDFVFWVKEDDKNNEEKPETD